jgi:fatty acid desaturase
MTTAAQTDRDRTMGTIVRELAENISTLFRAEISLLKLEIRDTVAKLGGGSALFAAAVFLALCGAAFLFVTITLGLIALGVPPWLSSLIVTVLLFIIAGVLALMGKKKFDAVELVPTRSVEQIKSDIETIKADIARVRSR